MHKKTRPQPELPFFNENATPPLPQNEKQPRIEKAPHQKLRFNIKGMHCASCAQSIERALAAIPGVNKASVNFALKRADVDTSESFSLADSEKLVQAVNDIGYEAAMASAGSVMQMPQNQDYPAWNLVVAITIGLLFLAEMAAMLFDHRHFLSAFSALSLAAVAQLHLARPFYRAAWIAAKNSVFTMDSLIAIGSSAAFALSLYYMPWMEYWHMPSLWQEPLGPQNYFEASALIISFVYIGQWLERLATQKARQHLFDLAEQVQKEVTVETKNGPIKIPVSELNNAHIVIVQAGERIPIDGIILSGESEVEEQFLTGESLPKFKQPQDKVYAGTTNLSGVLRLKPLAWDRETRLAAIQKMVEEAITSKPVVQKRVDKICAVFVPAVLGMAGLTFVLWAGWDLSHGGNLTRALLNAISVLVIACPCALGLATPVVVIVSVLKAAKNGLLIKNTDAFESILQTTQAVLDKTGTLTLGKPKVTDIIGYGNEEWNILRLAGSTAQNSTHPLSKAILQECRKHGLSLISIDSMIEIPGQGIIAEHTSPAKDISFPNVVGGATHQRIFVGNRRLFHAHYFDLSPLEARGEELAQDGKSLIYVGISQDGPSAARGGPNNTKLIGLIAVNDELRASSFGLIQYLKSRGLKTLLLTGDNKASANKVAQLLEIDEVQAEILPEEKAGRIQSLRQRGRNVMMIGDGINDAPALALADIGIAMAEGSALAGHAADVTLMRHDLSQIGTLYDIAGIFRRKIKQNLFWAFGFNAVAIPLAGFGLLHPAAAAAAMAASSLFVVGNALSIFSLPLESDAFHSPQNEL